MASKLLSERKIITAKPRDKEYLIADGGGLFLRVLPSGTKSWQVKFSETGQKYKKSLGQYPVVTLQQAREALLEARRNPESLQEEDDTQPDTPKTLGELFELWIEKDLSKTSNEPGHTRTRQRFAKHANQLVGTLVGQGEPSTCQP